MRELIILLLALTVGLSSAVPVAAKDYYRRQWFSYPDPYTKPKMKTETVCRKWFKTDVLEVYDGYKTRRKRTKVCTDPQIRQLGLILFRHEVYFVASGPAVKPAVVEALTAAVAGCAFQAATSAQTAAAGIPTADPVSRTAAGLAAGTASFKLCLATISIATVSAAVIKKMQFKIVQTGKWAPL